MSESDGSGGGRAIGLWLFMTGFEAELEMEETGVMKGPRKLSGVFVFWMVVNNSPRLSAGLAGFAT